MTETEWLACADPEVMEECVYLLESGWTRRALHRIGIRRWTAPSRKARLGRATFCRWYWDEVQRYDRHGAVDITEATADDQVLTPEQWQAVRVAGMLVAWLFATVVEDVTLAARFPGHPHLTEREQALQTQRRTFCELLRELYGNPFRPIAVDPSWLTSTVVAPARGIYEDRAFDRLPILADALMDAGCDCAELLDHCRGPGPHVRGCWAVDLLLGKQ